MAFSKFHNAGQGLVKILVQGVLMGVNNLYYEFLQNVYACLTYI